MYESKSEIDMSSSFLSVITQMTNMPDMENSSLNSDWAQTRDRCTHYRIPLEKYKSLKGYFTDRFIYHILYVELLDCNDHLSLRPEI